MAAWFDPVARELRYAVRRLTRDWRFTAAAILLLGLGIGANTAVFSVANAVLFREPPFADPDRLVDVYQNDRNGGIGLNAYPVYRDIAEYTDIFAQTMAASIPLGVSYLHEGAVRNGIVEYATATYLDVLGLRPVLGRWFDATEDVPGVPPVAVLGHQLWAKQFRSDPTIIGSLVRIEGVPVTVIGVGPANHRGTLNLGVATDFWLPIHALAALGAPPQVLARRPVEAGFFVKARLREGVTIAQARSAMNILGRRLASEYPDEDPGKGITVVAAREVRVHPQADRALVVVAALVLAVFGMVLATACSNLATMLLVRGAARAKEISVRMAVGATRHQLVRHLLTESVLLALAGGLAGCLFAWWGLLALRSRELPVTVDLTLDVRVFVFAVALSLVTGIGFGLVPALETTRRDLVSTLRDDGAHAIDRRRFTLRSVLIVFQVAVSVLLLGGSSIFLQMLHAARTLPVGYAVDGVAVLETDLRYAGYSAEDARNRYEELRRRIAALPGVESAALSRGLPMRVTGLPVVIEANAGETASALSAGMIWAGPDYFETLRIPVLYGRVFDARDRVDSPPVAVITESMARRFFGGVNAVGRRFRPENEPNSWLEVIGVVRDTGTGDFGDDVLDPVTNLFYRSYTQFEALPTTIIARTSQDAAELVGAMQRELHALDATLPVQAAKTMAQDLEESRTAPKAIATFLGVLAAAGLLLSSIGLYAVVAFTVARRSREIGVRMALGARSAHVVWSVVRGVVVLVGIGTAAGLLLSLLVMLALRSMTAPTIGLAVYRPQIEPLTFLAMTVVMALVGAAAAFVPARRAALADPLAALRSE
jgi:predicted permease